MKVLPSAAAADRWPIKSVVIMRTSPCRRGNISSLLVCGNFTLGFSFSCAAGRAYRLRACMCLAENRFACSTFGFYHNRQPSIAFFRLSFTFRESVPWTAIITVFPPSRLLAIIHNCDVICLVTASSASFTYSVAYQFAERMVKTTC